MKKFLAVILFITSFAIQGWGANSCTGTTNVTLSSVTSTNSSKTNATGKTYFFTADGPGTVTITTTTANNMALNASTTACPTNIGGTTTQTLTLTAADKDFNVRVFRTNGSDSKTNFTLTVNFTRACSSYKGSVMLNELRVGKSGSSDKTNQVELYNYGNVTATVWQTWKLIVYSKRTGTPTKQGPYLYNNALTTTANGQFIYNNDLAMYLRNRNGRSVDVALVDADGALIDYVAVESKIQNIPTCFGSTIPIVNATNGDDKNASDIARLDDGGVNPYPSTQIGWPFNVNYTTAHTISRTNVCSPGNDLVVTNSADTPNPIINTSLVTYTVNVLNKSCTNTITGIALTDTNISSTYFNGLSYTRTQGTSTQGASSLSWNVGTLAAGASATLTIAGTPRILGLLPTTASVTATTALDVAYKGDDNDTETINVRDFNYVGFDINTATVTEGTDLTYSASISSNLLATKPIDVNYTISGTAGAGDTDLPVFGSVTIDPTDPETPTQITIDFTITDDAISESTKSINFHITSVTSADLSVKLDTTSQDMNITLLDDDDPIMTDYRMDECSGNTLVTDSSINGNDATGGVGVTGGKLCNAKTFNGSTQYITLPSEITTQLKTSASLSFWIKTTQIGDDTMWLAPGISGVEQSGGGNDVFWGWIDATGHIGILKGNTAGAKSTNPINDGTWKHIILTRDSTTGSVQVYVNAVLNQTATSETGDVTTAFSRLGSIEDTGGTPTYFNGSLDEVKVFSRVLSSDEVTAIYTNDAALINYDGSTRSCQVCITDCSNFQYNLHHKYDAALSPAYRLHTRIANQSFDVNATVACVGTGDIPARKITKIYAVTGVCPTSTAGLPLLWSGSADINNSLKTITIPNLNSTKAYSNIKLMVETNASEFNCSTDTMAIRPTSFTVTTPTPLKAEQFTLTASATNSGGGYNGTGSVSTTLQTPNSECPISSNFLTFASTSLYFTADTNTTEANATDIGVITLNLKDTTWTAVDQTADCIPDSNSTVAVDGKFGCNIENNMTMTIIPHHFDVNATLSNAVTGFTYLSTDLNMSAQLDLNITAKTADGNTTQNYNTECYAKPTNYTINYTTPTITPAANLTKLNYFETNTSTFGNVATTANTFNLNNLPKTIFGSDTNGSAKLSVKINFDRNSSKPVNPFDLNITSVDVDDTDSVIGQDSAVGVAKFVYGRVHAYDIQTSQTQAPNPVEIEVYSTTSSGFVYGMPQNIINWYRNTNHDFLSEGNITKGGFNAGENNSSVVPSSTITNGIQNVTVTASENKTVHLDISPWLWYSSNNYNYSTNCTQHPCFQYQFINTSTAVDNLSTPSTGVNSGTFSGSDFEISTPKNTTKKGIKVFR